MTSHAIVARTAEAFFGKTPGADRTLIDWPEMLSWFQSLERMSPRVRMELIGQSTDGGEMVLLVISAPETIATLDNVRQMRARLIDVDLLRDPANDDGRLAGNKTVVLLTAGIHATEVGGVQLMPDLVANLALANDPEIARMLENVILLIVPTLNPDGMDLVHRWYHDTLGTSAEGSAPPMLYHRYAGHDNNRDWYTHALVETRNAVSHVHNPWRPHIVLDLHQMRETAPRYVVPPYIDPVEPHVHPVINALSTEVGAYVAAALVRDGRRGACSGVMFDCYSPTRAYQHYHGGVRILAEAASARIATPVTISTDEIKPQRGFDPNIPSIHDPVPWPGGTWRLRDIMDYHLTTIHAVLTHVAANRERWIRQQWGMLADEVRHSSPTTFIIAPLRHQIDPPAARELLEILTAGNVRMDYVAQPAPSIPAGSFLVRSNQPFGRYARALLEMTPYPVPARETGTPPIIPYDVTSHCLPIHMGVEVRRIEGSVSVETRPYTAADVTPFPPLVASDVARGRWLAIDPRSHASVAVISRAIENGADVYRLVRPHFDGGRIFPVGTWLVGDDNAFASMSDANQRAIRTWLVRPIEHGVASQRMPRIGLHLSWRPDGSDAGWMQLVLERLDIPFEVVRDADVQGDSLKAFDVVVVPHLPGKELLEGNSDKTYPAAYAGGFGKTGIAGIRAYLEQGGHVVAIDGSARSLIQALELPVDLPLTGVKPAQFSCPGSVLRVVTDPTHPVTLGMDESMPAFFSNSTAFAPHRNAHVTEPAHYAEHDLLLSGWMHGEKYVAGRSAIVNLEVGGGFFTGFGFRPHFRAQFPTGYAMLVNALLRPGLMSGSPSTS